jgi:hypothetical protein
MRPLLAFAILAFSLSGLAAEAKPATAPAPAQPVRTVEELLAPKPFYTFADLPRTVEETKVFLNFKIVEPVPHLVKHLVDSKNLEALCPLLVGKTFVGQAVVSETRLESGKVVIDARRVMSRGGPNFPKVILWQFFLSIYNPKAEKCPDGFFIGFTGTIDSATISKPEKSSKLSDNDVLVREDSFCGDHSFYCDFIITLNISLQKAKWNSWLPGEKDRSAPDKREKQFRKDLASGNAYANRPMPDIRQWIAEAQRAADLEKAKAAH